MEEQRSLECSDCKNLKTRFENELEIANNELEQKQQEINRLQRMLEMKSEALENNQKELNEIKGNFYACNKT